MQYATIARSPLGQQLAEISLRELARGAGRPTRPRLDFDELDEVTLDDRYPDIQLVSEVDDCAITLRLARPDSSFTWFDKPEDVIALVGEPEPPEPHMLRVPLLLVAIAAVTVGALVGLGVWTGVLAL